MSKTSVIRYVIGLTVLASNTYWLIDTINIYNKYQVKGILYVLMVPDWILFLRGIAALIGIVIAWKILDGSISRIVKWVIIDLFLFILLNIIDWVHHL